MNRKDKKMQDDTATIDVVPFRINLKTVVLVCIFSISVTGSAVLLRSNDMARVTALEKQCADHSEKIRKNENSIANNRSDLNIVNVQYARIETKLAEIAVSIRELKGMKSRQDD